MVFKAYKVVTALPDPLEQDALYLVRVGEGFDFYCSDSTGSVAHKLNAEVNVNANWDATSGDAFILNKPTLGTAAATNITDYATAAQGTTADTALQPEDIGITVQSYNVNTVIDANYVATEENFTTVEKARLASLYYAPTAVKTANYQAVDRDAVYCDTSGGSFSVTLPTDGAVQIVDVVGGDADTGFGVNNLVVLPNAGQTVTGETSLELDVGATKIVFALFGTDWKIVDISAPQFVLTDWSEIIGKPTYGTTSSIELNLNGTIDNYVVEGDLVNNGVELNHLSSAIQTSLDLADSAVQPGDIDQIATIVWDGGTSATAYYPITLDWGVSN